MSKVNWDKELLLRSSKGHWSISKRTDLRNRSDQKVQGVVSRLGEVSKARDQY